MFNSHKQLIAVAFAAATFVSVAHAETYSIGRAPTAEEVAGWDIDIRPDGKGLPPGEGSVSDGEMLYDEKCAVCHGVFGEGEKRWPKLAGGFGTLAQERPDKTVGSYWPYASTLWDYIHRAMPFPAPQSLTDDETYAISAYVLYLNELVDEDFVLTQDNLASIEMPNRDGFYRDNRPDVQNPRCMKDCKDPNSIEITQSLRGITPIDGETGRAYEEEGSEIADFNSLSAEAQAGQETYELACKVCHDSGVAGAPILGNKEQWAGRLEAGMDTLFDHAINGFQGSAGVMPPKGGQTQLSDEVVQNAVRYMVENSQ